MVVNTTAHFQWQKHQALQKEQKPVVWFHHLSSRNDPESLQSLCYQQLKLQRGLQDTSPLPAPTVHLEIIPKPLTSLQICTLSHPGLSCTILPRKSLLLHNNLKEKLHEEEWHIFQATPPITLCSPKSHQMLIVNHKRIESSKGQSHTYLLQSVFSMPLSSTKFLSLG